jgi:putative DNA primase/helicase
MTLQNTSPLAPASAYRAYQTIFEGAHVRPKSSIPPHHISHHMSNIFKILLTKKQNMEMGGDKMDFIQDFKQNMLANGIKINCEIIPDGEIHRFQIDGDSQGTRNGWYVFFADSIPSAAFGSWKTGVTITWCSKSKSTMSQAELIQQKERLKLINEKREIKRNQLHLEAKQRANKIWNNSGNAHNNHTYLKTKKVKNHNLKLTSDNKIIVPLMDNEQCIHSLQFITEGGDKKFLSDGKIKGNYFIIGIPKDKIFIAEGYATSASIYECTDIATICSFNCNNLLPVSKVIRKKFPHIEIIIACDNDIYTEGNPGRAKAEEAAITINAKSVFPNFSGLNISNRPTDFNDLLLLAGPDEVRNQLSQKDEWAEPEEIKTELLQVEKLSPELIPEPYRDFIVDVSERMQCPIDFVAITLMLVTATIVGTAAGIRPKCQDDWLVIPNLWGCIVGRPGMLKTPAVSEAMCFLEFLQNESKKVHDEKFRDYFIDLEISKLEKEAIKYKLSQAQKNYHSNKKLIESLNDIDIYKNKLKELKEPGKPIWRRFKTNDSTIEKLNELLSENPRGLLVYRDEIIGLLKTFEKQGRETDRAFFLEAWNGKVSQTSDRIGRGTIHAENLCLSVFGTTQPDKLLRYLYSAAYGDNDGLIQRLQLLVYPDEPSVWKRVDKKPNKEAREKIQNIIKNLAEMDFSQHGATIQDDKIPYFHFSEEAQKVFYEWWNELEAKLRAYDEHPIITEHLAKYRSLMPSLALLFHLIEVAYGKKTNSISKDNTEKSAAWCEYLESHARRVYALVTNIEMKAASLLSEKIMQNKLKDGFSVRDVYRANWNILNDKKIAQAACEELVSAGWLRELVIEPKFGQKRKVTYLINPKLLKKKNHG